jgi:hypothetical protein
MDIVIPYDGRDERGIGLELAVLSWRRFYSEHDAIYVVGAVPKAHGAIHIPFDDEPEHSCANVVRKVLEACKDPAITDPFILSNDDILLTAETDIIEHLADGRLSNVGRADGYGRKLRETGAVLRDAGVSDYNFELHRPVVIHKARYEDAATMFPAWQMDAFQLTSAYLNLIGFTPRRGADAKIRDLMRLTPDMLAARLRREKVVSFCESVPTWVKEVVQEHILG